jgi:uncharacterized HhH-GPD family protein
MAAHLHLSQDAEADRFISENPLALLIGLVLDQQVPLERAFTAPRDLRDRLGGHLDATEIASMDPDKLSELFSRRPALHRFPGANAKRVQELCRIIVDDYDGRPEAIWEDASSGAELFARLKALPGFGVHKARIFVGFLGKQLGVQPAGWREAASGFGDEGTYLSIADIVDTESLGRVRAHKKQMKAAAAAAKQTDASSR